MMRETSALPMKQPRSSLSKLYGSSDLPLYSLEAGFIVTKTALNGDTLETGTEMSDSVRVSFSYSGVWLEERSWIAF